MTWKQVTPTLLHFKRATPIALTRSAQNDLVTIDLHHLTHALEKELGMRQAP
jgi:hypothetical protein